MLDVLRARLTQGYRTLGFPEPEPVLPERFRGLPEIAADRCETGCTACVESCPTGALAMKNGRPQLDLGSCLFCPECVSVCPTGALSFTRQYQMATREREDLMLAEGSLRLARRLEERSLKVLGRSLKLRQVSAGGCNACESDLNVLNTVVFDLGRFGIQFVASPRHADGLVITGPVTENMRQALCKTYEAMPEPKIVIAVGACAISGGPYKGLPDVHGGAETLLPVDLYIPGCPPHPWTILDGLLRLLGKIEDGVNQQISPRS